jgi:hypothetical protein
MGQIKLWGALLMITLFALAIINFSVGFGNDNNVAISVDDDAEISTSQSDLGSDVQTFTSGTEDTSGVLQNSTISPGDETLDRTGQFEGGITGAFNGVKNVLAIINNKIFGGEQGNSGFGILITALVSFLTLIIGLYAWKTLAGTNPD